VQTRDAYRIVLMLSIRGHKGNRISAFFPVAAMGRKTTFAQRPLTPPDFVFSHADLLMSWMV
jgi:hypothetical protein